MTNYRCMREYGFNEPNIDMVLTCFRVQFIGSWIGRPGNPVGKASANVRECPGLSRRLLKCARECHWSFCSCLRVHTSASIGPTVNSDSSFGRFLDNFFHLRLRGVVPILLEGSPTTLTLPVMRSPGYWRASSGHLWGPLGYREPPCQALEAASFLFYSCASSSPPPLPQDPGQQVNSLSDGLIEAVYFPRDEQTDASQFQFMRGTDHHVQVNRSEDGGSIPRSGPHALLDHAAWECPPSQGYVTDTREKESPLTILLPKGRGPVSYLGIGVVIHLILLRHWSVRNQKVRVRGLMLRVGLHPAHPFGTLTY
ncbi:hypothetical protein CRG98_008485 [Punica granatum]|uniref:Uncharacterized protein n=1 Tax=Punica granatum TaxID=22663 RepID=A0A2I0KRL9_PUNGR|nr:hypothetical protein CRG98_008485 [Punica granatum]